MESASSADQWVFPPVRANSGPIIVKQVMEVQQEAHITFNKNVVFICCIYIYFALKPYKAQIELSVHVADNSICVFVLSHVVPLSVCLSVDNVSVSTMVPPTPTNQPITSHPTTPTLLSPSRPPDPKGSTSLLRSLNYPPSFSPSFSTLLWCLLI